MAKSKKPLAEQYKSVSGSFRKKISEARKQGFDVNYKINKPEQLTQEFIDTLRSIKIADIKQGVDIEGISVESYYAGEMDLRPTKRVYIEDYDDISDYQPPIIEEKSKSRGTVEFEGLTLDAETGEVIEPTKIRRKTDEELQKELARETKNLLRVEGYTDDTMRRAFDVQSEEENYVNVDSIEGFRNIDTFELISKNDPSIYVRDRRDRIIYDRFGNPLIKDNLIPVSAGSLSAEDYESLIKENILKEYGGLYSNERAQAFSEWLNGQMDKYGVFNVRDTLAQAQDEGYKMDYNFFYNATEEDYSSTINALEAMLALNYERAEQYQLDNSDYFESAEGGFNIDYKNG